jgi:hypothetical protein
MTAPVYKAYVGGAAGLSAYQIAVRNGYEGTEEDFTSELAYQVKTIPQELNDGQKEQALNNVEALRRPEFIVMGTDNAAFEAACNAAALAGGVVVIARDCHVGKAAGYTIPAGVKGIKSVFGARILFNDVAYTGEKIILTLAANDCDISGLSFESDHASFTNTAGEGVTLLKISGTDVRANDLYFKGRAQTFLYGVNCDRMTTFNGKIEATGPSLKGVFLLGFSQYLTDCEVDGWTVMAADGGPSPLKNHVINFYYAKLCTVSNCRVKNDPSTSGFGISFVDCVACTASDNKGGGGQREFVQFTRCVNSYMVNNFGEWDEGVSTDFAYSVDSCNGCIIENNVGIEAGSACVGLAADSAHCYNNTMRNNEAINCGYQVPTFLSPWGAYVSAAGYDVYKNIWEGNKAHNDADKETTYGYYEQAFVETQAQGFHENVLRFFEFTGDGASSVLNCVATNLIWDLGWQPYSPVLSIASGAGSITSQSVFSGKMLRAGNRVTVDALIQCVLSGVDNTTVVRATLPATATNNVPMLGTGYNGWTARMFSMAAIDGYALYATPEPGVSALQTGNNNVSFHLDYERS